MCKKHIHKFLPSDFELLPPVWCIFCPVRASGAHVSSERNPKQEKKCAKRTRTPRQQDTLHFHTTRLRCLSLTPWRHHAPRRQSSSSSAVADWRCCRMLNNCQIKCDPHTPRSPSLSPSLSLSLPPSPSLPLSPSVEALFFKAEGSVATRCPWSGSKRKRLSNTVSVGVVPKEKVCSSTVAVGVSPGRKVCRKTVPFVMVLIEMFCQSTESEDVAPREEVRRNTISCMCGSERKA